MEADWSIELGPDAPALELPWQDPEGRWNYVELRAAPGMAEHDAERHLKRNVDRIPEVHRFPALRQFLVKANAAQSAWQSAKCSVWAEETDPKENLYGAGHRHSSYVDVVLAGEAARLRESLETHQRLAAELAAMLAANDELAGSAEIVVRRCYFHRAEQPEESDAGYCLTIFLTAYGTSEAAARECWARALAFAGECLLKLQPGGIGT